DTLQLLEKFALHRIISAYQAWRARDNRVTPIDNPSSSTTNAQTTQCMYPWLGSTSDFFADYLCDNCREGFLTRRQLDDHLGSECPELTFLLLPRWFAAALKMGYHCSLHSIKITIGNNWNGAYGRSAYNANHTVKVGGIPRHLLGSEQVYQEQVIHIQRTIHDCKNLKSFMKMIKESQSLETGEVLRPRRMIKKSDNCWLLPMWKT
ncbi:hypothetical protein PROFUN_14424, partial [Planoprotostelium fungivorum]